MGPGKTIIVTSDEPWSEVWHTQLHYTFQLSATHNVIYLQPPDRWKFTNLFRFALKPKIREGRIQTVEYINYLPSFLGKLALFTNDKLNQFRLNTLLQDQDKKNLIVWHFDPMRSYYLYRGTSDVKHIYHIVDPYAGKMLDAKLASTADLVVVTSPKFVEHYQKLNERVMLVRQGVDTDFFRDGIVRFKENESNDERVLLIGTLSDELDLDLICNLAEKHQYKFLFIGPDKFVDDIIRSRFKNAVSTGAFTWLGQMSPSAFLPHLVSGKVGIIAYDNHNRPVNNLRSPLKVITYLAAGKPVITNIDCEIPELIGKGIYTASNPHQFLELLGKAFRNELNFDKAAVSRYLESVSYRKLITDIISELYSRPRINEG